MCIRDRASDDLTVAAPIVAPMLTKTFTPTSIAPGGTSTLTLTIANPNAIALSNIALLDTYADGGGVIANATPANGATTCSGGSVTAANGAGSVALSGGSLAAGANCTVTVVVTSSTSGAQTNVTGVVSSDEAPDSTTAAADLTVSNILAPTLTKTFSPDSIANGGVTTMTLVLTNPNAIPLTAASLVDTYLPGADITNAAIANAASTCGVVPTAANNGPSVSITGGTIPANGSCMITVDVTGTTAGTQTNTTGVIETAEAPDSATATDDLVVAAPIVAPTLSKVCLLYTSPSPRDATLSRMPSSA